MVNTLKQNREKWYPIGSNCTKCKKPREGNHNYCKKCWNNYMKLYRYGISQEIIDSIENSSCEICGSNDKIVIDHNHKTNKFRGLLCSNCNVAIGLLKDDIKLINNVVKYLSDK